MLLQGLCLDNRGKTRSQHQEIRVKAVGLELRR